MNNERVVKRHECRPKVNKETTSDKEWSVYIEKEEKMNEMLLASSISNYGEAIEYIEYVEEGDFWVAHCNEYATIIKYCPFCGKKL